jgi:general secretion pathway protein C
MIDTPPSPRSPRRAVAIGVFLGITVLAWLAAMGTGRVAAVYLALPDDAEISSIGDGSGSGDTTSSRASTSGSRRTSKRGYVDPILARNIFDSSATGASASQAEPGDSIPKTDLKVILLATVVAEPSAYSSALIGEDKKNAGATGYGIGDDLMGTTIVRIEQRRVVLQLSDGTFQALEMDGGKLAQKKTKAAKGDSDEDGVEKVTDNKFIVDQEVVDKLLANPEQLYSQVRVVPHKGSDGAVDGYRLSGIRRKSVFRSLGMKNGDIVHNVNGKGLDSISSAMDAYSSLQNDKDFSFEITRRNQRQTFEYEIR